MKNSWVKIFRFTAIVCIMISALFFATQHLELYAQGTGIIEKSRKENIPKVRFLGLTGSQTASAQVKSNLSKCGWFEVVDQNQNAEYTISGTASATAIQLQVRKNNGTGFNITQPTVQNSERETAHHAVDQVLKKTFNIKGICAYKILFARETGPKTKEIFMCDFDGGNIRQVTHNKTMSIEPAWGPKNQTVLYTLYSKSQTYVAETKFSTGLSRRLSQFNGMNAAPAVNPNGGNYACTLSKDGRVELYVRSFENNMAKRITNTVGTEASPCYAPDGSQICFVSDERTPGRPFLCRVSSQGGAISKVPTLGASQTSPDWSNDNKIAYAANTRQGASICVTDLSGKATKGVGIIASGGYESPSWAPDNRHIVCQQTIGRRTQLWVIDTWTGNKRLLMNTNTNTSGPAWQR